jgi:hypothetical protein
MMMSDMPTKDDPRITTRIPQELHDKLRAASERDGLSQSLHVITALRNYLEHPQAILTTPAVRDRSPVPSLRPESRTYESPAARKQRLK